MHHYNFRFLESLDPTYAFETEHKIGYVVRFKDSSYIFKDYTSLSVETYGMVIEIASNPGNLRPPLDTKISETIAAIFRHFFYENHEQSIIYICDSSDNRQLARKRKFDHWIDLFWGEFLKFDGNMSDTRGIVYYTSLIIHHKNARIKQIQEVFYELVVSQQK